MILDFFLVLMTKNLFKQTKFYSDLLELDVIFDNQDTIGLGKNKRLFIVLREDKAQGSHHLAEHKGPQIITFKCQGDINQYIAKFNNAGCKIRDTLKLPDHNTQYLFIEDPDENEICLEFLLAT